MSETQEGTREYLQKAHSALLKKLYNRATKHPRIGLPLIRFHCRLRPDFTDADPLKTVWTDPSRITAISNYSPRRAYGVVASGNWDKDCTPIDKLPAYEVVKSYILDDNKEAVLNFFKQEVQKDSVDAWGHSSLATFDQRLNQIDQLYQSISEHGYLSQKELLGNNRKETIERNNDSGTPLLNEITVDISRNGDFLYCGYGAHRLGIAKVLDVDRVCVKIGARHKQWQQLRDEIRSSGYTHHHSINYRGHPDLRDITPDETV